MKNLLEDRLLTIITASLFVLGLVTIGYVLFKTYFKNKSFKAIGVTSCVKDHITNSMKDDELLGILERGQEFHVLMNYYQCNPVKRGDLIYYKISDPIEPVVKVARAIPGDKFEVLAAEDEPNTWHIKINGQFVMAGDKKYFFVYEHPEPPLKTYEISRHSIVGPDEYIILSTVPPGMSDSRNFGLVRKDSFVGRVFVENPE